MESSDSSQFTWILLSQDFATLPYNFQSAFSTPISLHLCRSIGKKVGRARMAAHFKDEIYAQKSAVPHQGHTAGGRSGPQPCYRREKEVQVESVTCPRLRTSEVWDQHSYPYLRMSKQVLYTQLLFSFLCFGMFVFVFITGLKRICGSSNPPPHNVAFPTTRRSPE